MAFTEGNFENVVINYLQELDYTYIHGSQLTKEDKDVLLLDRLEDSLVSINSNVQLLAIKEAIRKIRNFETNDVFTNNKLFHKYLVEGVEVSDFVDGEVVYQTIKLIDFEAPSNNDWLVVNQLEVTEDGTKKRPDVFVYVNGIPLVVMELKSTSREEVTIKDAYNQLMNYKEVHIPSLFYYNAFFYVNGIPLVVMELKSTSREEVTIKDAYNQLMNYKEVHIPSLFYYNAFLVISDGVNTKAGTITASYDRFMSWKKIEAEDEVSNVDTINLDTLMCGMFDKARFLNIIKGFILFTNKAKIMAQYHQYYGMTKAIASCIKAVKNDGRAGVVWHTQGSGKSYSMTFLAGNLVKNKALSNPTILVITDRNDLNDGRAGVVWHTQGSGKSYSMTFLAGNLVKNKALSNPTILVITDRNDLDGQLFATFCSAQDFLRQEPVQMESRSEVKAFLGGRKTGGVVFSTIQKFVEETGLLSDRQNIIVLVDEAHRTQYGMKQDFFQTDKILLFL